jgi:prohibitin 2
MSYELAIDKKKLTVIASVIVIVVISLALGMASVKFVGPGEKGVLTHWNAVDLSQQPLASGIHFVTPFQDDVIPVNIQVQAQVEQASSASKDLQIVSTTVTVNYHPDPTVVNKLYQNIGLDFGTKIINPAVQETVKAITAKYNAEELITQRPLVKSELETAITQRLAQFDLLTDQVSITDFNFSPEFNTAIELKVTAQQNALAEANKIQIKQAQAQQAIAEAQGIANATIIQAEGQGKSIEIINQFLSHNPQYLEWLKTNKWDGHLPGTLVTGSGSSVPFINLPTGVNTNGS